MKIWVVGMFRGSCEKGQIWSLVGIFQNERQADMRCRTINHFMAPFTLNSSVGDDPADWPGLHWPRREEIKTPNGT